MSLRNEGFSCRMEGGNKHRVGWSQLSKNAIDKGTMFFLNLNTFQEKFTGLELGEKKSSMEEKLFWSNVSNSFSS